MRQQNLSAMKDAKRDYWQRVITRIFHKGLETYVILRIWDLLDDNRIKFVPQQNVIRPNGKRALVDLYLPQIDFAVEVNEPYHNKTKKKDHKRNFHVAKRLRAKVRTIDCSKSLDDVHSQISCVVNEIRKRVMRKGDEFIPWYGLDEYRARYHRVKDVLEIGEDFFDNSDEICRAFNLPIKKRGWQRAGGSEALRDGETILWWPRANSKLWKNEVVGNGRIIYEMKREPKGRVNHVAKVWMSAQKRIVFFYDKDPVFGWWRYRFMGLYHLDREKSKTKCVWIREKVVLRISDYSV